MHAELHRGQLWKTEKTPTNPKCSPSRKGKKQLKRTELLQSKCIDLSVLKDKVLGTTEMEAPQLNPYCIVGQPFLPGSLWNCLSGIPRERARNRDRSIGNGEQSVVKKARNKDMQCFPRRHPDVKYN